MRVQKYEFIQKLFTILTMFVTSMLIRARNKQLLLKGL